jgi:3-hydroxyethyl bacteriochlorophyllide a dehydrogenase
MDSLAIVIEAPGRLSVQPLALDPMSDGDVLVEIAWSGISAGTERLLWSGLMPFFPGLAYPLVPGYESVGRIVDAGRAARGRVGEWVFVPGARCFRDAHGLFGGAAQHLVVPAVRALPIPESLGERGVLIALAATAHHMLAGAALPELIVGHGVLGRLLARLTVALGAQPPTVWEKDSRRREGGENYAVLDPAEDERRDYRAIYDVSGDGRLLDSLIARLGLGGEVVLGGFYHEPLAFAFAPAFQREARLRVAAEWAPEDLAAVRALVESGALDLAGLVTDVRPADEAAEAYEFAFTDPRCLKMVIDWRNWA